jgi:hypothetical protein
MSRTICSSQCQHLVWQSPEGKRLCICDEDRELENAECSLRDLILDSDEGAGFLDEEEGFEWLESDDDIGEYQEAMQREILRRGLAGVINKRYLASVCGGDLKLYWETD